MTARPEVSATPKPARQSVSALVVSFNVRAQLERCLASLACADEIVVVDNASSDGSAAMVREHFASAQLLAFGENRGFSVAVNAAAAQATSELLLLLNPDASLPEGGLPAMCAALAARPWVWALGFRQVDSGGRFQLAVGPPPWLSLEIARRMVQRSLDRGSPRLARLLDRVLFHAMPVPWVAGSSLLVRRAAFERVGGFDERFFLYFEDVDFCLRLRRAGGSVWYDPNVTVVHERGASAARDAELAARAYRESQLWFWEKHRGRVVRGLVHGYQRLRGL